MLMSANKKESFFAGIEHSILLERSLLLVECSAVVLSKDEVFKDDEKEVEVCSKELVLVRTPPNLPLSRAKDNSSNW